jgi:hypothetical protein
VLVCGLRVLMSKLAVLVSRIRVFLRLVVLAEVVVVSRLMMVMRGGVVVSGGLVMMFGCRVFRFGHLGLPCRGWPDLQTLP